ncbi:hypothetical protein CDAR_83911 [Caerostris darwini]|uniref:Uncharacterized protein n=1 Tax=Caerostris darwini TaxID=1538125 RepID=A0AAV4X2U5_9ARAC|nr:hypothetical protein CDAR_83911 [Caerostris darwini]
MIDMEVSMEENGPSQVHQQAPSSPGLDVNVIIEINESNMMTPQGLCRRLVSAHQEMEVIDEILTSSKKSDFQNDYLELNANLSKKEYLLKWVSRFGICPIAECKIHHADLKPNQSKTTTKRAATDRNWHLKISLLKEYSYRSYWLAAKELHEIQIVIISWRDFAATQIVVSSTRSQSETSGERNCAP